MTKKHTSEADGIKDIRQHLRDYDTIDEHLKYCINGYNGEFDVYAERGAWNHYYEYKASWNHRTVAKAEYQFLRVLKAMPKYQWRFILVTPQGCKEYHREELLARRFVIENRFANYKRLDKI
jgi:hypothetical protein